MNRDEQQHAGTEDTDGEAGVVNIASMIVHVRPEKMAGVKQWISGVPQLDIQLSSEACKLVLLLETPDHFSINQVMDQLREQSGVVSVVMVYHEELSLADASDYLVEEDPQACDPGREEPVKVLGEQ